MDVDSNSDDEPLTPTFPIPEILLAATPDAPTAMFKGADWHYSAPSGSVVPLRDIEAAYYAQNATVEFYRKYNLGELTQLENIGDAFRIAAGDGKNAFFDIHGFLNKCDMILNNSLPKFDLFLTRINAYATKSSLNVVHIETLRFKWASLPAPTILLDLIKNLVLSVLDGNDESAYKHHDALKEYTKILERHLDRDGTSFPLFNESGRLDVSTSPLNLQSSFTDLCG